MTCDEARDAFSDLYDGILSGPPLVALSRHLDECQACRAEWKAFRLAMRAVSDLGTDEPPPGFAARVLGRIERPPWWRRAVQFLVFPLPVKIPLHGAALLFLVLAGWWMVRETPEMERVAREQAPATPPKTALPPAAPAKEPAPPPVAPGKVGVSPRLKGEMPTPPRPASPPAPPAAAPSAPSAGGGTASPPRSDVPVKRAVEPPTTLPAPAAESRRVMPAPPPAASAPRAVPESAPPAQVGTAPPGRRELLAKPPAGPLVPAPTPEAERRVVAPGPSAAPPAGGPSVQKEASERELFRAEERGTARDAAERAAPLGALSRAETPSTAAPPAPRAGYMASAPPPAPASAPAVSADERFSTAVNAFAAREYVAAAADFRAFLSERPQDLRAADARFYLAESLFALGRYGEAASAYAEFLRERPDHRQAVTALYRQGLARLAAGDAAGCPLLKSALERAPRARDAAAAKEALGRCP